MGFKSSNSWTSVCCSTLILSIFFLVMNAGSTYSFFMISGQMF
jgi:hypothetical protein